MEELQAKWTFDQGGFAKALIAPTPMGAGYHLHLVKFGKQSETIVLEGVVCGRGRNPTLRLWPAIFSGEIDVFPSERRNMGQEIGR